MILILTGLADPGRICGAINQGLIYAGMPLNPSPHDNESVTTVLGVRSIATGCQRCSHLRSHINYAEENEV
jgi:hypothetical protein